jgi:hypothetical protein
VDLGGVFVLGGARVIAAPQPGLQQPLLRLLNVDVDLAAEDHVRQAVLHVAVPRGGPRTDPVVGCELGFQYVAVQDSCGSGLVVHLSDSLEQSGDRQGHYT